VADIGADVNVDELHVGDLVDVGLRMLGPPVVRSAVLVGDGI
jgi:hypothetical protein